MIDNIRWEEVNGYRNLQSEAGDYWMIISGGGKHEFNWVVFYKKEEVASSRTPCRSVPEAQRICEAIYQTHKIFTTN